MLYLACFVTVFLSSGPGFFWCLECSCYLDPGFLGGRKSHHVKDNFFFFNLNFYVLYPHTCCSMAADAHDAATGVIGFISSVCRFATDCWVPSGIATD